MNILVGIVLTTDLLSEHMLDPEGMMDGKITEDEYSCFGIYRFFDGKLSKLFPNKVSSV